MKNFFILAVISSCIFASELLLQEQLLTCSKIKKNESRLICFDNMTKSFSSKNEDTLRAQVLTTNCAVCHGKRWDLPTKVGSLAVRHMKEEDIYHSLLEYKKKNRGSVIMQNQMIGMTKKEIESISRYIVKSIKDNK